MLIDTVAEHPQAAVVWSQMAEKLRAVPGVEKVGISIIPAAEGRHVWQLDHGQWRAESEAASDLEVSPNWLETMRIPLFDGRNFRDGDSWPNVAIVSKAFAKEYFGGANPIGRTFQMAGTKNSVAVVGVVARRALQSVREATLPVFYVPFQTMDDKGALFAASQRNIHGAQRSR